MCMRDEESSLSSGSFPGQCIPSKCYYLFPVLSPTDHIRPVPPKLTPFLSYHALQVTLIYHDYTRLCLVVPSSLPWSWGPEHWSECTPSASGMQTPSEITWPSCDNHATTCHPSHLISRPPTWKSW